MLISSMLFVDCTAVFICLTLPKFTTYLHAYWQVLVVAVLGVLPVVSRTLSNKAYRLSLLGTALSSFYSLYTLYGVNIVIVILII